MLSTLAAPFGLSNNSMFFVLSSSFRNPLNRLYVELLRNNPDWDGDKRREDLNHFFLRTKTAIQWTSTFLTRPSILAKNFILRTIYGSEILIR